MQLNITEQQVWLSTTPVDFIKSIDGLSAVVQESLQGNPQIGIYLFFNKNKDKVKILGWHKNGFVLVYKKLERGKFTTVISDDGSTIISTKPKLFINFNHTKSRFVTLIFFTPFLLFPLIPSHSFPIIYTISVIPSYS